VIYYWVSSCQILYLFKILNIRFNKKKIVKSCMSFFLLAFVLGYCFFMLIIKFLLTNPKFVLLISNLFKPPTYYNWFFNSPIYRHNLILSGFTAFNCCALIKTRSAIWYEPISIPASSLPAINCPLIRLKASLYPAVV
jgi:hypothetical protein